MQVLQRGFSTAGTEAVANFAGFLGADHVSPGRPTSWSLHSAIDEKGENEEKDAKGGMRFFKALTFE